jgi:hypothetical protein
MIQLKVKTHLKAIVEHVQAIYKNNADITRPISQQFYFLNW